MMMIDSGYYHRGIDIDDNSRNGNDPASRGINRTRNLITFTIHRKPNSLCLLIQYYVRKECIQMVAEEIWNHLEIDGSMGAGGKLEAGGIET